ncbi:MAG: S-methyl-5-thioribose-1-phosphate isomerase [Gammaproteobacteria bacterium]|nr:S-methyl-5-thioribose-1-phosphate isomerase [Gammaproteobacteria bacterium]
MAGEQQYDTIRAVVWEDNKLKLLDQRLLPHEYVYNTYTNAKDTADAIRDMVVRGAPAIGVTAAYAVVLAATHRFEVSPQTWRKDIEEDLSVLAASRPTAVNLFWAIDAMRTVIAGNPDKPIVTLLEAARRIHNEDITANRKMGEMGSAKMLDATGVLTHCNTGSLATGGYGTALGVIRSAWRRGHLKHVFADETRPWLQGARLTAWELVQDDIPVTLISEGAAAHLMKQGKVQWVVVGSDRIAANGDVANKIGTYSLAVNARHHGVKFMVVAPSTTVDMDIASGDDIPIEERSEMEVLCLNGQRIAPDGATAWNPAFDVTPAELIDVIVTEKGLVENPTPEKMAKMMSVGD